MASPRHKHGPTRLSTYFDVHTNHMQQLLQGGFVHVDALQIYPIPGHFIIEGLILCEAGIYLDVRKRIRVLAEYREPTVQAVDYKYNVAIVGRGTIFRYDSPHIDHRPEYHKHEYDVLNGDVEGTTSNIYNLDDWPTLREVVDEAATWYYDNLQALIDHRIIPPMNAT